MGISFVYGIFHAAGPGHGKAVIASYLLANEETWRRGVTLSFASALLQALVAIVLVAIAALLIGATAKMMGETVRIIELISYSLIVLLGARLLWVKGGVFIRTLRTARSGTDAAPQAVSDHAHAHDEHSDRAHDAPSACTQHDPVDSVHQASTHDGHPHDARERELAYADHDHGAGAQHAHAPSAHAPPDHAHGHHGHDHHHHHGHGHHHHTHGHDDEASVLPWGHAHGPEPEELAGPGGWRRGLSAIVAVGLRPCSGAILVLVFALAQGLFWAGVASTFVMGLGTAITVAAIATLAVSAKALAKRFARARAGYGALALRGVEVAAALTVIVFGIFLLTGYMATERMGMF
jgi:nickel/cobalt exporter